MQNNSLQALIGNQAFDDWCEKFVEQEAGLPNMGKNAITAWINQQNNANSGLANAQIGSRLYFSPNESNGNNGHVAFYLGNGKMYSATDNGVQVSDINQWMKETGQQLLGNVPTNNQSLIKNLSNLKTPTNSLSGWGVGNPAGPANITGDVFAQANQGEQQSQNALQQQQQYQTRLQKAQSIGSWFQGYKQQQAQQIMGNLPTAGSSYVPYYNFNQNYF